MCQQGLSPMLVPVHNALCDLVPVADEDDLFLRPRHCRIQQVPLRELDGLMCLGG